MISFRFSAAAAAIAGFVLIQPVPPAFAAGDGGDGDSGTSSTMPPKCKDGEVWDPEAKRLFGKGKCVDAADFQPQDDEDAAEQQGLIYDYGKSRAKAGDFEHAIAVLRMAPDPDDPRVLNYLGYSHRKLGRMDEALGYYRAAVAADPDFSLVREYLGEAYIQLGLLEKAREQLSEIERICGGRACGEYRQLADLLVESQLAN